MHQSSPPEHVDRYDALSLNIFNAARALHNLPPVDAIPKPGRHLTLVRNDDEGASE